ncbi:hypothetical protein LIER_16681 [Lithospermum erythrorhizon]|uniref:DUF4283 domain-containing protein n=1 Tax=Lithospermum erythrorhizon TaxID=34254 RepID=A0AAV3Q7K8_LITER
MEADLARVLGSLSLEGEELGELVVPDVAYDRVKEKYQFSLVVKVLDMGVNLFHVIFVDDVQILMVLQGEPWLFEGHALLIRR